MSDQSIPPIEETTGLDTCTKWVWRKWLLFLSSGGVAFFLLIWALIGPSLTNLTYLVPFYMIFFFILVYLATHQLWEEVRKNKLEIINTLKDKTSQIEKLTFEKDDLDQESRQLQLVLLTARARS